MTACVCSVFLQCGLYRPVRWLVVRAVMTVVRVGMVSGEGGDG